MPNNLGCMKAQSRVSFAGCPALDREQFSKYPKLKAILKIVDKCQKSYSLDVHSFAPISIVFSQLARLYWNMVKTIMYQLMSASNNLKRRRIANRAASRMRSRS